MFWQLRAIDGPLEGAVYRLRSRVTLGRAGDCDIQIVNDGVSRRHAKVVAEGDGHLIIDLASNNGTFVCEARVDRHRLRGGDEIRIMRSRFVYEAAPAEAAIDEVSGVWAVKVTNVETLRQTIDHITTARGSQRGETLEDMGTVLRPATKRAPVTRPRAPERHRINALRPDGTRYLGDVVGDIQGYRELQRRMVRGDSLSHLELELIRQLERAFGQPLDDPSPYGALRRHARFRCRFPARVRWVEGSRTTSEAVYVQDIGVGGAKLTWRNPNLEEGAVVWLVIDLHTRGSARTLVFPTRVAWVAAAEVGLQFAGNAEWQHKPA